MLVFLRSAYECRASLTAKEKVDDVRISADERGDECKDVVIVWGCDVMVLRQRTMSCLTVDRCVFIITDGCNVGTHRDKNCRHTFKMDTLYFSIPQLTKVRL